MCICVSVTLPVQTAPQSQGPPGTRGLQLARPVAGRLLHAAGWG